MKTLMRFWKDEDGLTTVEYALLLALVVVVAITAWTTLGGNVKASANTSANAINVTPSS